MNPAREAIDAWNHKADTANFTVPVPLDRLVQTIEKEDRIVDVGCGYGRTLAELDSAGYRYIVGADPAHALLHRARREHPGLLLAQMAPGNLPFREGAFDAALLLAVLTAIPDEAEQEKLIGEIRRVLCPRGVLCLADFLINDDPRNTERYARAIQHGKPHGVFQLEDGQTLRHHDPAYVAELLRGFEIEHEERTTFTTMRGNTSNGIVIVARKT